MYATLLCTTFPFQKFETSSGLSILLHDVISLPDATYYDEYHLNRRKENRVIISQWCKGNKLLSIKKAEIAEFV